MSESIQQKTIKNAKHFFKYRYDYYLELANEANSIKGITLNNSGVSCSPRSDNKERLYLKILDAQKIVTSVKEAINTCRNDMEHPYKDVIQLRFIKCESTVYVVNHIPFEKSVYFQRILPNALIEFSNKFLIKQLVNNVENIIDLTVSSTGGDNKVY